MLSNPLSPSSKGSPKPNLKISVKSKSVRVKTFINEKYKAGGPIPRTDEKKSKKLKIINENEIEISSSFSDRSD